MDGCPVEELGLDFTLPGYPNIELRKGGRWGSVLTPLSSALSSTVFCPVDLQPADVAPLPQGDDGDPGEPGQLRVPRVPLAAGGGSLHTDGGCQGGIQLRLPHLQVTCEHF